jgi:uncharacterized membrane protein (UPF0127 family)
MARSSFRIDNLTKRTELATAARLADNPWSRLVGLLVKKRLADGEALLLRPCSSIHTLFMRFAIDVVYLGKDATVLKVVPSLKPFRFSGTLRHAHYTLELPAGTIDRSDTSPGDLLAIATNQ